MQLIIAWHEETSSFWANCPDWKKLMVTDGYTIGEVEIPQKTDEFSLKKYMKEEGYERIPSHDLNDFISNLNDEDAALLLGESAFEELQ